MENATFTSKTLEEFNHLAGQLSEKYAVCVQLAQVIGNRWSYLAGTKPEVILYPPQRFLLKDTVGIVIYNWRRLSLHNQSIVLHAIKKIFMP